MYSIPNTGGPAGGLSALLRLATRFPVLLPLAILVLIIAPVFASQSSGMVTVAFDDGYASTYLNAAPIMEEYGITGTVYVVPQNVETGTLGGFMDLSMLKALNSQGWNIECHSMTHPDLTSLVPVTLKEEIHGSKEWLEGRGFKPTSFASPYGLWNSDVLLEIANSGFAEHRTAWPRGLNQMPDEQDMLMLATVFVEEDENPVASARHWIDEAIRQNKWLILSFHRVGEDGEYNVTMEQFKEIMLHLHLSGVPTGKPEPKLKATQLVGIGLIAPTALLIITGFRNRRRIKVK